MSVERAAALETNIASSFATDPLWYKDAIIYQMHVKAFFDANNDGIGDFAGLAQKLDYIQELGVNTIWLLPFYPSPLRDDGYDIADYLDVHPDYGTLDDFRNFIAQAHRRGLKVITELVINHTSDQHPWFQAARRAPKGSPERDFYVWSDSDKQLAGTRIIFTDTESSNWAWDPVAGQYYWHRFFSHQPDLNHNNPAVVDAVIDLMRFWLDMGVDGLRLDAIPYLCVREGTDNENLPETHAVLKRMRAVVDANYQGRMFLAEANQWPEDVREYFGDGDECHMAYHFPLMPRMYMAVALEDRYPISEILRQTPDIPENCQWAIFLRNHDELTLEMVTDRERDYMYKMYANELRMRVNVGIRRRLAPLLTNDIDRIKLMNSMLLSMPGSPVIYYGDEIGMGDNIYIGDRNGVRTPMQWSLDRNAGFSRADPQRLYLPVIMDPIYGFQAVNVEAQNRDPSSLLNWTRRMLVVRRQYQCFGRGTLEFIRPQNRKVLAYVRSYDDVVVLCVANLSQTAQAVELDLAKYKGRVPVEMLGNNAFPPVGELPYFLTLPAHGYFWLLLSESAPAPAWHVERLPATELPVLVLASGLSTFMVDMAASPERSVARRALQQFEREVLPEFLQPRGWFKSRTPTRARLQTRALWTSPQGAFLLAFIEVEDGHAVHEQYSLPLALAWEDEPDSGALRTADWTLAKIRERARVGVLIDAFADPRFCIEAVKMVATQAELAMDGGKLLFESTHALRSLIDCGLEPVDHFGGEQTRTRVVLGESVFLKAYRRLIPGTNPDLEMTRHITATGFPHVAAPVGAVRWQSSNGPPMLLLALFQYVGNQGHAWGYVLDHLERHATQLLSDTPSGEQDPHALIKAQMRTLGRRIGELHALLARPSDDAAFAPEPITDADLSAWYSRVATHAAETLDAVQRRLQHLPEHVQARAHELIALRERLIDTVRHACVRTPGALKTRVHGNLHLKKILLVADDFLITDFDGDMNRPPAERREKISPMHDVATMLRSFAYARASALERAVSTRPDLRERASPAFAAWERVVSDAFLRGYRIGVRIDPGKGSGAAVAPESADCLLKLFQIERALHELDAELTQRTSWVGIPLEALLRLTVDPDH
jgi:maltose alpha-D-glucosyltransferase/alpha-amylase